MNLRTKIGVVAVLLSTLTVQAQNIPFRKAEIKETMKKVADWQIANPNKGAEHGDLSWTNAVLYVGMLDWAELAEREDGNKDYFKWLTRIGSRNGWQPDKRMYHADDIAVSQLFIDLYRKYKNKYMLNPTIARTDWVMKNPPTDDFKLDYRKPETLERWTWCDALFMAPPVYTKLYVLTGDKKYIKFMNREYKATYDHLFDKEENLCTRVAKLQNADGFWHASLLDPASYPSPETSCTTFIVYALAYGINEGLLDKDTFLPILVKGWNAQVSAVDADGKLGYVQPIGADPKKVTRNMTEVYGVGAFLMGGCEIYKMAR